jgi:hypothetical protein
VPEQSVVQVLLDRSEGAATVRGKDSKKRRGGGGKLLDSKYVENYMSKVCADATGSLSV